MSDQAIAAKLEEAAKLLHGAASAFRHGRHATGVQKWDKVYDLLDDAEDMARAEGAWCLK